MAEQIAARRELPLAPAFFIRDGASLLFFVT